MKIETKASQKTLAIFKVIKDDFREQVEDGVYPIQPPTYRQLRDEMGYGSTSTVAFHIDRLIRDGLIVRGYRGSAHLTKKGREVEVYGSYLPDHEDREVLELVEDLNRIALVDGDEWEMKFRYAQSLVKQTHGGDIAWVGHMTREEVMSALEAIENKRVDQEAWDEQEPPTIYLERYEG
jgi:hypothetical protein